MKTLVGSCDHPGGREFAHRLDSTQRDEGCLKRMIALSGLVGLFAVAGFAYTMLFTPEILAQGDNLVVSGLCAAAFSSLFCILIFFGVLVWHRILRNQLFRECRQFILHTIQPQPETGGPTDTPDPDPSPPAVTRHRLLPVITPR